MRFYKALGGDVVLSGYTNAVAFLSKPILESKPGNGGNDFRLRMGGLCTIGEGDEITEALLADFFTRKGEEVKRGLQSVIDASVKKHCNSAIVPQIDGLIATFILLLKCKSESDLSQSLKKVVMSGSSPITSKTSFLYSKAMIDATSTDVVVKTLLHKSIGLASSLGDELKSLVCLNSNGQPSAASYALAASIACPLKSRSLSSTLQNVLECVLSNALENSKASGALATALLLHTNEVMTEKNIFVEDLKSSREARESNDVGNNPLYYKFDVNTKSIRVQLIYS